MICDLVWCLRTSIYLCVADSKTLLTKDSTARQPLGLDRHITVTVAVMLVGGVVLMVAVVQNLRARNSPVTPDKSYRVNLSKDPTPPRLALPPGIARSGPEILAMPVSASDACRSC